MAFVEPVGSAPYSVGSVPGYLVTNQTGTFAVPTTPVAPVSLSFRFAPPTFAIQFDEQGLPSGTAWSVQINSTAPVNGVGGSPIDFNETNGTYQFVARTPVNEYRPVVNASGHVTVDGSASEVLVTFQRVTYPINFTESGLPSSTSWAVTLGTNTTHGDTASIVLNESNGSYSYRVGGVTGYTPSPSAGTVSVSGAGASVAIVFTAVVFVVSFTETGLPSGTSWSVTFNGFVDSGVGTLSFPGVANGTYLYTIGRVAGYVATPSNGSIVVNGRPAGQSVGFAPSSTTTPPGNGTSSSTFLGLPADEGYSVLGVVIIAVLAVTAVVVIWGRGKKNPPETASPPSPP
jgi:hypothetical protein